jgi:dTDP-4-amino-4,6-dideoxygalactose transaminase
MSEQAPTDVPYARPWIDEEDIAAMVEVLRSDWLTTGPRVREFEAAVASVAGAEHAIALNSCTAAMHLALAGWNIGPGDEVITSPLTFCSTANVAVHLGARPVFADVDPVSLTLDPEAVRARLSPRTRAITAVHYGGHPADMDALLALSAPRGIHVLEDAAHAMFARYRGRPVGSLGHAAAFSFYVTKNIVTAEGGMLTTADAVLADRVRSLSLHGLSRDAWKRYQKGGSWAYDVLECGYKCNMTDIVAALGVSQLRKARYLQAVRRAYARRYDAGLADVAGVTPLGRHAWAEHSEHLYVVQVDPNEVPGGRTALSEELAVRGIGTSVHFRPVHLTSAYRERFGTRAGECPVAERAAERVLSLPLYPRMTSEQVDRVIDATRDAVERLRGRRGSGEKGRSQEHTTRVRRTH